MSFASTPMLRQAAIGETVLYLRAYFDITGMLKTAVQ
jgi:hypothetical protein